MYRLLAVFQIKIYFHSYKNYLSFQLPWLWQANVMNFFLSAMPAHGQKLGVSNDVIPRPGLNLGFSKLQFALSKRDKGPAGGRVPWTSP